jgi:lysozyme
LKKVIANHNDQSIKAEFLKWNKAGGKVLAGLTRRREAESNLYFK